MRSVVPAIDDRCIAAQNPGVFPLSQPCNAQYDLMPPVVDSTILVLLATGVVTALVYVFGPDIRREPASGAG